MFNVIVTAIMMALPSYQFGFNAFTFDDPNAGEGDTIIAIVSHHASIGPFPEQPGWEKLGEISQGVSTGPRTAAFKRAYHPNMDWQIISAPAPALDVRATGVLVAVSGGKNMKFTVSMFDGTRSIEPLEWALSPVQVAAPGSTPLSQFVWLVADNTYAFNYGPEGFVGEGIGVSMPAYKPSITESPTPLNFTVARNASPGPNTGHDVLYSGIIVLVDPLTMARHKK